MDIHPFPYFDFGSMTPEDGVVARYSKFCRTRAQNAGKCQAFYESIRKEPGPHLCPCGFSAYVWSESLIYSGIRLYSFYDRKKTKHVIGADYVPLLSVEALEKTVRECRSKCELLKQTSGKLAMQSDRDRRFINATLHEIRGLNSEIIVQASELKLAIDKEFDLSHMEYLQLGIYKKSFLISMRLNAYDFLANPDLITSAIMKPFSVHGKFHKVKHSLTSKSKENRDTIRLDGQCRAEILGYSIFDILPYVLLDNALKFSPPDKDIWVTFFEDRPDLKVTIASEGPPLEPGEEERIFEEGYRGVNALKVSGGSGLGLYVAKQVCAFHNIEISAKSVKMGPVERFMVTLEFDPQTLVWR